MVLWIALHATNEEVTLNRREFLKIAGLIAGASAGVSCSKEKPLLLPYIVPPEKEIVPGELIYYNTTCNECPASCGISARVVEKIYNNKRRLFPVKLEGNSLHPVNEGKLCLRGQTSITKLYAYDDGIKSDLFDRLFLRLTGQMTWVPPASKNRLTAPLIKDKNGNFKSISWDEALRRIVDTLQESKRDRLKNYYLSGRTTGTLSELIVEFCNLLNVVRLPEFELYSHATLREANKLLFNYKSIPFYNIEEADLLLTIGADIVETFVSPVSYSCMISRAREGGDFQWFHIEPHISITGISSGNRFVINPGTEKFLLIYLIRNINSNSRDITQALPPVTAEKVAGITGLNQDKITLILNVIKKSKKPLVITGGVATESNNGFETAVLAGLLNYLVDSKKLMDFSRQENYDNVGTPADLIKFTELLKNERSGVVFISRTDPAEIVGRESHIFKNAMLTVGISEFFSRTMMECDVILPLSDNLESWGDAEPRKGIRGVVQPVTEPLFDTLSEGEILQKLSEIATGRKNAITYQEYLLRKWGQRGGEEYIKRLISEGVVIEERERVLLSLNREKTLKFLRGLNNSAPEIPSSPALIITPSLRTYDGLRSATPLNHEIPDPLSSVSYGEWAGLSEESAESEGIKDGDEVEIDCRGNKINLPIKVMPGLRDGVIIVHREFVNNRLTDLNKSGDFLSLIDSIRFRRTGKRDIIPALSGSMYQEGRGIIPERNHREHSDGHGPHTLYPAPEHKEYRWAMVIDLELCTGCSACVAACYVENNIPVVGKKLHLEGREISWIRIEPYFDNEEHPVVIPMLCQQCSYAPCESVCPVYATYHNPDGLNAQIYNRCVGTRYCANNCPYKVRRFNWFNFKLSGIRALQYNPDVLVRHRGVMEKCTFCIQRIRRAKDKARDEGRKVMDGEVLPACAQTCPSRAITFGNILDKESKVHKLAQSERAYRIFEGLGTEPAVYYLKKED